MNERKTIRKWFFVWEYEKEEQWLNLMAQEGWLLEKVGFATFHFVSCEPGAHIIRLEMHEADDAYLAFMKEMGAVYIGRVAQWVYFSRPAEDGPFDLFSDIDSRIYHMEKIGKMLTGVATANLLIGIVNSFGATMRIGWINLLCATLLTYALGRIHGRIDEMKKTRLLRE
ncbi:MAG: DUF2812 domain-containing protein [Clostridia bacterium]|nr:DUF2812 domain-containing protein [Clostridia bacterium]